MGLLSLWFRGGRFGRKEWSSLCCLRLLSLWSWPSRDLTGPWIKSFCIHFIHYLTELREKIIHIFYQAVDGYGWIGRIITKNFKINASTRSKESDAARDNIIGTQILS